MTETVIHEDDTCRVVETTSDGWPDKAGSVRSVRTEWKPGHEPVGVDLAAEVAALRAEVRGMKERAAAEAAKSTTTAKGVAQAISQGPA